MLARSENSLLLLVLLAYSMLTIEGFRIHPPGNQTTTVTPPRNVTIEDRVVGGGFASLGQIRHMAVISRNGNFFCGGSLITNTYILTAAHCGLEAGGRGFRVPVDQLAVRLGTIRLSSGGTTVKVAELKIHPNYRFIIFDVGLLRLAQRVQFTRLVNPIRIASTMVRAGTQLTVSGFGAIRTGGTMDDRLRTINMPVLNDRDCYRNGIENSPSIFCLGHPVGRGICQGDSGGPAFTRGQQYGVVSFTVGGCGTPVPDGFAKVPFMNQWIRDNSR